MRYRYNAGLKMAFCEICGREANLSKARVETTELLVCPPCSSFGRIIEDSIKEEIPRTRVYSNFEDTVEIIPSGYGKKIKDARTWMGLNQKEFASKLSEKESVIQNIETESLTITLELAKKIERVCNIKLVTSYNDSDVKINKKINFKDKGLTIGDLIKLKDEE